MKTYLLTISSPDGDLFCGEVTCLSLRGIEGDLAVMAGHVPFITAVVKGTCKIETAEGSEKRAQIEGGLLTVGAKGTTLLCTGLQWDPNS